MKTLTITEAKKNLGRWLVAAASGDDVGIILGADIIALRKVEVESTPGHCIVLIEHQADRAPVART